jgi:hypothetical protein
MDNEPEMSNPGGNSGERGTGVESVGKVSRIAIFFQRLYIGKDLA